METNPLSHEAFWAQIQFHHDTAAALVSIIDLDKNPKSSLLEHNTATQIALMRESEETLNAYM